MIEAKIIETATSEQLGTLPNGRFAGIETPLYYKPETAAELVAAHRKISAEHQVSSPYLSFTDKGQQRHTIADGELEITFGRIGAFTSEEIATLLQEQASNYVHQDTMGRHFPVGNAAEEQKLLAEFMGGFNPMDVVVMVTKKDEEGSKPIAGSRVTFGNSTQTILEVSDPHNSVSTLATFQSVSVKDIPADMNKQLSQIAEWESVCLTRVFQQESSILQQLEIKDRALPVKLSALMPIAYTLASIEDNLSIPQHAFFDTHLDSLINLATKYYGGVVIADKEAVQPKDAVMNTMIGYHYANGGADGGYKGKISVAVMPTADYLLGALNQLHKLGVVLSDEEVNVLFSNTDNAEGQMYEKLLNMQLVNPLLLDINQPEAKEWSDQIEKNALVSTVDHRLDNAMALFTRFNPGTKKLGELERRLAFFNWLKEKDIHLNKLTKPDEYLYVPQGIARDSGGIKAKWQKIAILPEPLYRLAKEATGAWMMDSPDGKQLEGKTTRDILWEDTEVIALGCSVGSQIIDALAALNIQHFTLVDKNDYDAIVQQRMANPDSGQNGLEKAVKMSLDLKTANPRMKIKTYTELFTRENADKIFEGQLATNPNRRLIIVEEVDDPGAKRLAREKARETYDSLLKKGQQPHILLIMISDEGRTANGVHLEVIGEDKPFNGTPLEYNPDDPTAEKYPSPVQQIVAMVGASQGNKVKSLKAITAEDIGVPIEMISALSDIMTGKVGSFLQSPIAARQSGVIAATATLAWIEDHLNPDMRNTRVDLSRIFDDRYVDPQYLQQSILMNMQLEQQLYGKSTIKLTDS